MTSPRLRTLCGSLVLSTALLVSNAALSAQDTQLQDQLQLCAKLQNSIERLSCYDRTVASIGAGEAAAQAPPASPEAMFGVGGQLSRETSPLPKATAREEIQSISAVVKELRITSGALLIELDNGQTWQQMDGASLLLKVGDRVTITRGALNSFRLNTPGKRAGRVRRAQ
jgi:hypothetical protein